MSEHNTSNSSVLSSDSSIVRLSGDSDIENAPDVPDQLNVIRCVNFNQDFTSLCVGTARGYEIYDVNKNDELQKLCANKATNSIIVQRLYSSSLVAVVSEDHSRKLNVNHFKKDTHICSYTYIQSILNVMLNRERLVVVCEDRISIHVVKDMELIHAISDTPTNKSGLCALANSSTNCFIAYPACTTTGTVQVFDAYSLKSVVQISAHDSPLQCLSFNNEGTMLATASVKGTVIRVFTTAVSGGGASASGGSPLEVGNKLYELRRGISRSVTIYSLSFSADNAFLLASSNTPTIHCFRLQASDVDTSRDTSSTATDASTSYTSAMYSMFNSAVSASAAYLPTQVAGMMVQERAYAWATLPSQGNVTKVALTSHGAAPRVIVCTCDGMVYVYDFNRLLGGECKLLRQHNLGPRSDSENALCEATAAAEAPSSRSADTEDAERAYAMQQALQPPPLSLNLEDFPPIM